MNLLQVSKYYYPEVGGIEQVVRTIAEGVSADLESRVLAAAADGAGGSETMNGVEVRKVPTVAEAWSVPLSPTFPTELARAADDADVVHLHLPNPVAVASYLALDALATVDPRNRGIVDADHALVVTYHSDIVRQSAALSLYRPLLQRVLERADAITVTSPRLLAHSEHLKSHRDKCEVVPLSVDLDEYGDYSGPEKPLPGHEDRPTLLFVGRLSYYKGVEYLVDAIAELASDADLLIVGDGEDRERLERQVRLRGVDDRVHFLGRAPEETLKYAYETADLFVLPSVAESEAFGVVQLEAMAQATPVVNTNLPTGVPWVSQDGETGLTVPPGDAHALAEAIDTLLDAPERRRAMGRRARERVETKFSHDRMVDQFTDLYGRVTEGSSGSTVEPFQTAPAGQDD